MAKVFQGIVSVETNSILEAWVRQVFKGGNYSKEERINVSLFNAYIN